MNRNFSDIAAFVRPSKNITPENSVLEEEEEADIDEDDGWYDDDEEVAMEEIAPRNIHGPNNNNSALVDMLLNNQSHTNTITMNNTNACISPAISNFMRVTNGTNKGKSTPQSSTVNAAPNGDTLPLDDAFNEKHGERLNRIAARYEVRKEDDDDYNSDEEEEDDSNGDNSMSIASAMATTSRKRPRSEEAATVSIKKDCFLCSWGDKFHDGIRVPHITKLFQLMDKFYGIMSNYDLAESMHQYYVTHIYNKGEGMYMLETYAIIEHLESCHSLAALNFIVESIRKWKKVLFLAENSMTKSDHTIDGKAFAIFEKAQSKLEKLYTMNIKGMNFNQGQTIEDLNSKGLYFNLMPMFSQKEERYKRQKTKQLSIESCFNSFAL